LFEGLLFISIKYNHLFITINCFLNLPDPMQCLIASMYTKITNFI
jgi:hypothetical protein